MRWSGSLLAGRPGTGDDAPLGIPDEAEDVVTLLRLREVLLDVGNGIADVHPLEEESVIDVLDLVDFLLGKAAAGKTDPVHALEAHRFAAGEHIRRDVLDDLEPGAHHGMHAHMGELVRQGASAQDGPVLEFRLARQGDMAHEDAVAADAAVMGDMDIGHHERVAAHLRHELAAGLGAAVDGGALADGDPVPDLHPGDLAFILEVLRDGTHDRAGEYGAVAAHFHIGEDDGMREDMAAVADFDIRVDEGVGADFDVVSEFRVGAHGSERMDLIHGRFLFQDGTQGLCGLGVEGMARLESRDAGMQPAACETHIPEEVQQFVPPALVREMQLQVVQVAFARDRQVRHVQQGGDAGELLLAHRMLHDDDGIVHVTPFDEVVLEQVLDLVEEAEGTADTDFAGIVHGFVPMGGLDAEDAGTEVHGDVCGRDIGRFDAHPGSRLAVPDFQGLGDVDIDAGNPQVHETVLTEGLHVRAGAAVQDGNFHIIQFDERVVHAHTREGRHDVLDGDRLGLTRRNRGAAGGGGDILGKGIDLGSTGEVRTAELDAVSGRGRRYGHVGISPCVKAFPLEPVRLDERMLVAIHSAKVGKKSRSPKSLLAALPELRVGLHVHVRVDARGSQERLPLLPDVADDAGLRQQRRMVRNLDVPGDAHLSGDDAVLADDGGPGDTHLGRHHRMVADHHVVRDLAQVVDPHAVADDGGFHLGAVHGGVGADFHVVADNHVPEVLDLLPTAVLARRVAEAVVADDAASMQDHPVSDDHARENLHARIDNAVLSDLAVIADGHVLMDDRPVPDHRPAAYAGEISQPDLLAELRGAVPAGAEAAVAAGLFRLGGDVLQQFRHGGIGVVHADKRRLHRLLGLEGLVHQDDGRFARIDVLFVFGIGEETQGAGLSVLDLGKLRDDGVLVPVHGPLQHLRQLFCGEFHSDRLNRLQR